MSRARTKFRNEQRVAGLACKSFSRKCASSGLISRPY